MDTLVKMKNCIFILIICSISLSEDILRYQINELIGPTDSSTIIHIEAIDTIGNIVTEPADTSIKVCINIEGAISVVLNSDTSLITDSNYCVLGHFKQGVMDIVFTRERIGSYFSLSVGCQDSMICVIPSGPYYLDIVNATDSSDVFIDTMVSKGGNNDVEHDYIALIYDKYGNLINVDSLYNRISWSVTGDLDASGLSQIGNEASYNAKGLNGRGSIIAIYHFGAITFSDSFQIIVDPISIEEHLDQMVIWRIKIHPNPFNPQTAISFPNKNGNAELHIYSIDGKIVKSFRNLKGHQVEWMAAGQSSGIYVLLLHVGDKVLKKRVSLIK